VQKKKGREREEKGKRKGREREEKGDKNAFILVAMQRVSIHLNV
jgi:hypothetical protein